MVTSDAALAVLKLNPHPGCYAKARYVASKGKWEFPIVKLPLTAELAEQHVRGDVLLGAVASDEDGYTSTVGLDLDAHLSDQKPAAAAKRFVRVAQAMDVPVVVHSSKSGKGAHIRTLFKSSIPTYLARSLYLAMVISAGLSADKAVDKVWPPTHGLGVLAMPYNAKVAKQTGGSVSLDPYTLQPLARYEQLMGVLDSEEMSRDDLESSLVSMGIRTDMEAQLFSQGGMKKRQQGFNRNQFPREIKDQVDGGVQYMVYCCDAVKRLQEEAANVPYEFWFGLMTNFRPFIGGREIFEEISKLDPSRYDARHIERTWRAISGGPRRCENLDAMWDCPSRATCPAKSPAGLPFAYKKALGKDHKG